MEDKSFLIAPSLLSSDFSCLGEEVKALEQAGADWIHFDVMDGHFVPNLSFGIPIFKFLRSLTSLPLDVHLMVEEPEKYLDLFISYGAERLTLHIETMEGKGERFSRDLFEKIQKKGAFSGLSLKPQTAIESLLPFLKEIDLVLVMTVEPGFGGQKFMEDQLRKLSFLYDYREKMNLSFLIELDGGVNDETAQLCSQADVLVAGNFIFQNLNLASFSDVKDIKEGSKEGEGGRLFKDSRGKDFFIQKSRIYSKRIQSLKMAKTVIGTVKT